MSNDSNKEDKPKRSEGREQRSSSGGGRPPRRGGGGRGRRRRQNSYCPQGKCYDYKDFDGLRRHLSETGKIKPRRQTGNCSRCQRELAREIKRARHLALLPFVSGAE